MSFLTEDLDPRLVLLTIEANYKPRTGDTTPVRGLLVLSRVGLHFYPFDARRRDGTLNRSRIEHATFAERFQRAAQSVVLWRLLPLGKFNSGIALRLGYLASWGSGSGQIIAGISNMAHRMAARNESQAFIEAVDEAEQLAPPLPEMPEVNLHLVRMTYFADASALGPALFYADRALECARLQAGAGESPGFFKRVGLRGHGWDQKNPLPIITTQQLTRVKRYRAWLLIDGQRCGTLVSESQGKQPDSDAEVMLAYGVARALLGRHEQAPSFLERALQAEPDNLRVMAGAAWGLALQGRAAEARQMLSAVPTSAQEDRHALLLLGCALETLGNEKAALNLYMQSAALASGYFQGTVACQRALALANKQGNSGAVQIAQQLTALLPEQREAWEGLIQAAERAGNTSLARQAREQVAAMQGAVLVS